jgi:hypothetical protein
MIAAHPALAGSGVTVSHTTHGTARRLAKHFGWPMLDPRQRSRRAAGPGTVRAFRLLSWFFSGWL